MPLFHYPALIENTLELKKKKVCAEAFLYSIVLLFSEVVKDHIQEAKAYMSQTCQDMEAGLSLSSHYVDVQVSQRETFRSGKNTSKFLDKEIIVMGDTDRQKSLLGRGQVRVLLSLDRIPADVLCEHSLIEYNDAEYFDLFK